MAPKELYMAKSFEELENIASSVSAKLKPEQYVKSLVKLQNESKKAIKDGDQEKAYLFYLRFFIYLNRFRETSEFQRRTAYYTEQLGGSASVNSCMDILEDLSNQLRNRYMQLELNKQRFEHFDLKAEPKETKPRQVTVQGFYELLQDKSTSMLVLDCRPRCDFAESRIKFDYLLNIPEEILVKGSSVGRIQESLSQENQKLWTARAFKEIIILLDYSSEEFTTESPIWVLRDILQNWDQNFPEKATLQILVGGYKMFQMCYPQACENPKYEPKALQFEFENNFADISYPELTSQSYTKPRISKIGGPPKVDRSTKANIINKTLKEKEQYMSEILIEQQKVVDKSLEAEKEKLQAEYNWVEMTKNTAASEEEKRALHYRILELESKTKDYEEDNKRLREERDELLEITRINSTQDADVLEAQTRKREFEEAELERRHLAEQQRKLKEKRERELEVERQRQKAMQETNDIDVVTSIPPHMPTFDRSNKPTFKIEAKKRDFSPVRGGLGKGLTGLKNLGNTCYMNSIIQCLSHTKSLEHYFLEGVYTKHRNMMSKTQCKIVEEVAAVIKALAEGHKCISSRDLKAIVGQYQRNFCGYEQQDSHEFLTILMDWLHSDLQAIRIERNPTPSTASEDAWNEFTKMKESVILRLFYGQIKSTVECTSCHIQSTTYDTFSNLSLELPQHTNRTHLDNSMNSYFENERITGWMCPKCKVERVASKKLDISRLPGVLVIHLKRFHADLDGHGYRKKQNHVFFPLENLSMRSYIARTEIQSVPNQKFTYNLYAVSNHYGSMEGGHYTAFCKGGPHNRWYKFDDHQVSSIDESEVQSSAAYILFYQLESPRSTRTELRR